MNDDTGYQAWTQAENDQQQQQLIVADFIARRRADYAVWSLPLSQPASNNPDAGTTADTGKEKL